MGWNDRLPEDPYLTEPDEDELLAYEEWLAYVEERHQEEIKKLAITQQVTASVEKN